MDRSRIINLHDNFLRNNIPINKNYTYEILAKEHVDQVVRIFTEAFCRSEPMTEYLHLDEKQYDIFSFAVTEKAVKDKLSVVCLDKGKVIAFAIVEDITDNGVIPDFDPKFKYILGLLEKLGANFFAGKVFPRNHIAHLFITAVDEQYRHLGLSTQVNFCAMDLALEKGFDFVYCEFTNYYNEKGVIPHLKNKKKLIGDESYEDFALEGEKPFKHLSGGARSFLWETKPDSELIYTENDKQKTEYL